MGVAYASAAEPDDDMEAIKEDFSDAKPSEPSGQYFGSLCQ